MVILNFFMQPHSQCGKSFTPPEIIAKIYEYLINRYKAASHVTSNLLVLESAPQIGILEKIATGTFHSGEPLTFIDMLRVFPFFYTKTKEEVGGGVVVHLKHLLSAGAGIIGDKKELFLNVNEDLNAPAKWAVLNLKQNIIYCETPLLLKEIQNINNVFKRNFLWAPRSCKASSPSSTGYSAVAWFDENLTKSWNFDVDANLHTIMDLLVFVQRGGDASPYSYSFTSRDATFFDDSFKKVASALQCAGSSYNSEHYKFNYRFVVALLSGNRKWGNETFPYADISSLLRVMAKNATDQNFCETVEKMRKKAQRNCVPGFNHTISEPRLDLLTTTNNEAVLKVNNINGSDLIEYHKYHCDLKNVNRSWFSNCERDCHQLKEIDSCHPNKYPHDYAAAIVLAFVSSKAKKEKISIHSAFKLTDDEINILIGLLENNAFVCEFKVSGDETLVTVQKAVLPVIARNRWLNHCGYKPPLFDNYWEKAASHWVFYLYEQEKTILENGLRHQVFKDCVRKMGLKGLNTVLDLLGTHSFQTELDTIYGFKQIPFYVPSVDGYLQKLSGHIQAKKYFPFNELAIECEQDSQQALSTFLKTLYSKEAFSFESVSLFNVENVFSEDELIGLFDTLIATLSSDKNDSRCLLHIPDLESTQFTFGVEVLKRFRKINNIILQNRRDYKAKMLCEKVQEKAPLQENNIIVFDKNLSQAEENSKIKEEIETAKSRIRGRKVSYPMSRGGGVQLELQQQQELSQQRQMTQEKERVSAKVIEDPIGELVTYQNIDNKKTSFYKFYQSLSHEITIDERAATLKTEEESPLQGFFHTWINANPNKNRPHIISGMTKDAACVLLQHHRHLTAGLQVENLPRGFYTQFAADDSLILCYRPEIGYVRSPNPLTLHLDRNPLKAEAWEGDFTQFDLKKGLSKEISDDDIDALMLFQLLQPHTHGNEAALSQAYECYREVGVEALKKALNNNTFEISVLFSKAFLKGNSLSTFVDKLSLNREQYIALGQIYYQFGNQGLLLFLQRMEVLSYVVGVGFVRELISTSENLNDWMTVDFFESLNEMIEVLKKDQSLTSAWTSLFSLHTKAGSGDSPIALWKGFQYFAKELKNDGLAPSYQTFKGLSPQNMLVFMDRVLASLEALPTSLQKQQFMQGLSTFDLQNGGVHYAIQKEGFKVFDDELELHDFYQGSPTYLPSLKEIWEGKAQHFSLNAKRLLAVHPISSELREAIYKALEAGTFGKEDLMIFLLTQNSGENVLENLSAIKNKGFLAEQLYNVSQASKITRVIDLEALSFFSRCQKIAGDVHASRKGVYFETLTLLFRSKQEDQIDALNSLFLTAFDLSVSSDFFENSFKLLTLLGRFDKASYESFLDIGKNTPPVVEQAFSFLFKQLLSLDLSDENNVKAFRNAANFDGLIEQLQAIKNTPHKADKKRQNVFEYYVNRDIQFKYSISGNYRALQEADRKDIPFISFFHTHEERVFQMLKLHVAISDDNIALNLTPLMTFLKSLSLNKTEVSEIEYLLSLLEDKAGDGFWTSNYLYQLLKSLESEKNEGLYPFSLLKVLLESEVVAPKSLNHIELEFPEILKEANSAILNNTVFSRKEQASLLKMALTSYRETQKIDVLYDVINTFQGEVSLEYRETAFAILTTRNNVADIQEVLHVCENLLVLDGSSHRTENATLWLKAIFEGDVAKSVFDNILKDKTRAPYLLHIIAFSGLTRGKKAKSWNEGLFNLLKEEDTATLKKLATYYPKVPSPDVKKLYNFLHESANGKDLFEQIEAFLKKPYKKPRADYGRLSELRKDDFERMLQESYIVTGAKKTGLNDDTIFRITFMFSWLKGLENKTIKVPVKKEELAISEMSQEELKEALSEYAAKYNDTKNDFDSVVIWALLFEALGRTTKKYPHMAQQFSLILNQVTSKEASRICQVKTGEGKSHDVGLEAAWQALFGKSVEISTAKRALASRDQEEYEPFYTYLGFSSAHIMSTSSVAAYNNSQIKYGTLGDFSLFFDGKCITHEGKIERSKKDTVGLLDEVDFILYDEGVKTEYNYAKPIGKMPTEMAWFYSAVNAFYRGHTFTNPSRITEEDLSPFFEALCEASENLEERLLFLLKLASEPLELSQWLQSAREASELEHRVHYTIREEQVVIDGESLSMRLVVPLSSDNQLMQGAYFSRSVQQLCAHSLNEEAKRKGERQNFYIPIESDILSSQTADALIARLYTHFVGYTGSSSDLQNVLLQEVYRADVLAIPTNQESKRVWHEPRFFNSEEERTEALLETLSSILTAKESNLFACKNDRAVHEFKRKIEEAIQKNKIGKAFMDQCFFYTNEDKLTPAEVLARKKEKEAWVAGQKTESVLLNASGFGRGDNVGVENVILTDVNDSNDRIQKGGRTGRNGQPGQVFQFYLKEEVNTEYHKLHTHLENLKVSLEVTKEVATEPKFESYTQKYDALLELREKIASLQNLANMGYRRAVATFTASGMEKINTIQDPTERHRFANQLISSVKAFDRQWVAILSENGNVFAQIKAIEQVIRDEASRLSKEGFSEFYLTPYQPDVKLFFSSFEAVSLKPLNEELVRFCQKIIDLQPHPIKDRQIREMLPDLFKECEKHDVLFNEFLLALDKKKSIQEIYQNLKKIEENSQGTLATYRNQLAKGASVITDANAEAFQTLIPFFEILGNELTDVYLKSLSKVRTKNDVERLNATKPILEWLSKFNLEDKKEFALARDYLSHIEVLTENTSSQLSAVRFQGKPRAFKLDQKLWALLKKHDLCAKWPLILNVFSHQNKLQRFILQLENIENSVPSKKHSLFDSFVELFSFAERQKKPSFLETLLFKTMSELDKNEKGVIQLWQQLSKNAVDFKRYSNLLECCFQTEDWLHTFDAFSKVDKITFFYRPQRLSQDSVKDLMEIYSAFGSLDHWRAFISLLQNERKDLGALSSKINEAKLLLSEGLSPETILFYWNRSIKTPELQVNLRQLVVKKNLSFKVIKEVLESQEWSLENQSHLLVHARREDMNDAQFITFSEQLKSISFIDEFSTKDIFLRVFIELSSKERSWLIELVKTHEAHCKKHEASFTEILNRIVAAPRTEMYQKQVELFFAYMPVIPQQQCSAILFKEGMEASSLSLLEKQLVILSHAFSVINKNAQVDANFDAHFWGTFEGLSTENKAWWLGILIKHLEDIQKHPQALMLVLNAMQSASITPNYQESVDAFFTHLNNDAIEFDHKWNACFDSRFIEEAVVSAKNFTRGLSHALALKVTLGNVAEQTPFWDTFFKMRLEDRNWFLEVVEKHLLNCKNNPEGFGAVLKTIASLNPIAAAPLTKMYQKQVELFFAYMPVIPQQQCSAILFKEGMEASSLSLLEKQLAILSNTFSVISKNAQVYPSFGARFWGAFERLSTENKVWWLGILIKHLENIQKHPQALMLVLNAMQSASITPNYQVSVDTFFTHLNNEIIKMSDKWTVCFDPRFAEEELVTAKNFTRGLNQALALKVTLGNVAEQTPFWDTFFKMRLEDRNWFLDEVEKHLLNCKNNPEGFGAVLKKIASCNEKGPLSENQQRSIRQVLSHLGELPNDQLAFVCYQTQELSDAELMSAIEIYKAFNPLQVQNRILFLEAFQSNYVEKRAWLLNFFQQNLEKLIANPLECCAILTEFRDKGITGARQRQIAAYSAHLGDISLETLEALFRCPIPKYQLDIFSNQLERAKTFSKKLLLSSITIKQFWTVFTKLSVENREWFLSTVEANFENCQNVKTGMAHFLIEVNRSENLNQFHMKTRLRAFMTHMDLIPFERLTTLCYLGSVEVNFNVDLLVTQLAAAREIFVKLRPIYLNNADEFLENFFQIFCGLSPAERHWFITLMETHQEAFQGHPQELTEMLQRLVDNHHPLTPQYKRRAERFVANMGVVPFDELRGKCFETSHEVFHTLDVILHENAHVSSLLSDNVSAHITRFIANHHNNAAREIAMRFYEAVSTQFTPENVFSAASIRSLFDFSNMVPNERKKRVIFMHFLNARAFVKAGEIAYRWTNEDNDNLLTHCFNAYLHEAETQFEGVESHERRGRLLNLAEEMRLMGETELNLEAVVLPAGSRDNLWISIDEVLGEYEGRRFKSDARDAQVTQLRTDLLDQLQNPEANTNVYREMLYRIRMARQAAINDDVAQNMGRFFKLNRGGHSRYLETLDTLHDKVVQKWLSDTHAAHSFHQYRNVFQNDYESVKLRLTESIGFAIAAPVNRKASASRFFRKAAVSDRLTALGAFLNGPCPVGAAVTRLQTDLPHLPGHIQVIAREVLSKAEVLLEANETALEPQFAVTPLV